MLATDTLHRYYSLDSLHGGLHFMLGYQPMLDGGYNDFTVTAADAKEFSGRWESELGPATRAFLGLTTGIIAPGSRLLEPTTRPS